MDKLSAIQAFVRVVEAGTFTRAADLLQLPKPTVTRLIQTLEQQLDTKLLNRTTRRLSVTTDGAAYYDRAVRILGDLDELESSMLRSRSSPRGLLRVDMPASVGVAMIIPALPDFMARYPEIQLDLGLGDRPVDLVSENVDCVVRGGDITDLSLVARRVGDVHLVCCASPGYLQQHGSPQHPDDLTDKGHSVIFYRSAKTNRVMGMSLHRGDEQVVVQGAYRISINDGGGVVAATLAGLGVGDLPRFLVKEHLESGRLVRVLPDWQAETFPIHVIYPPNRHLTNKVRVFVDWVAELLANSELVRTQPPLRAVGG